MSNFVKVLLDVSLSTFWWKNNYNFLWAIAFPHKKQSSLASKSGGQLNNENLQQETKLEFKEILPKN